MKIKRSILCLACSAVLALLSMGGLIALKPVQPDHPAFFLPLLLSIVFAISLVTRLVSFLCCVASVIFPIKRR